MRTLTVLTRALALMEKGRWVQNNFDELVQPIDNFGRRHGRKVTCFCVVGAIRHVTKLQDSETRMKAIAAFTAVLPTRKFSGEDRAFYWNDRPRRTIGQVRSMFREAIKHAA